MSDNVIRGMDAPLIATVESDGLIWGAQDGKFGQFPATAFKGDPGTNGIDGIDGVGVPAGGTTGQALVKASGTDYDTEWGAVSGGIVDLSSASSDYTLAIGEKAMVDFSSATSVLLHVALSPATYEVEIINTVYAASPTNAAAYLEPNNTTYSNAMIGEELYGQSSSPGASTTTDSAFYTGFGLVLRSKLLISTFTASKHVMTYVFYMTNAGGKTVMNYFMLWNDYTTVWSSLGTLTFPNTQSGRVLITRTS